MAYRSPQTERRDPYPAHKARQGEIILHTPLQRTIFVTGLAGIVVLAIFFALLAWDAKNDPSMRLESAALEETATATNETAQGASPLAN